MTTKEKLDSFREKIGKTAQLNNELKNLITIELFDYIRNNSTLKEEFFRRAEYLANLAKNEKFIYVQDQLFKKIVSALKIANAKQVSKLQKKLDKEYKNEFKLIDKLKKKDNDDEDYALNLKEAYNAMQDKDRYFRLGYRSPVYGQEEFSRLTPTFQLSEQYKMVERLFQLINSTIENETLREKYKKALDEYNKIWHEFHELIFKTPIKLHIRDFEEFLLFCSITTPVEGYEVYHQLHGFYDNEKLETVKSFTTTVIDDLIEVSEAGKSTAHPAQKVAQETSPKADFIDEILHFQNKEIDFRNKQNQKDLLKTLFKDRSKNWFYDEVQEDWDETGIDKAKYSKNFWNKFYTAGDKINMAVAVETSVKDFIIKNTKEIRINPKYI